MPATQVTFTVNTTCGASTALWSGPAYACALGVYIGWSGVPAAAATNVSCQTLAAIQTSNPIDPYP